MLYVMYIFIFLLCLYYHLWWIKLCVFKRWRKTGMIGCQMAASSRGALSVWWHHHHHHHLFVQKQIHHSAKIRTWTVNKTHQAHDKLLCWPLRKTHRHKYTKYTNVPYTVKLIFTAATALRICKCRSERWKRECEVVDICSWYSSTSKVHQLLTWQFCSSVHFGHTLS